MKGGYGNRPRVGIASDTSIPSRWRRDVDVLLETWPKLVAERGFSDQGAGLVWTVPWDGATPLNLSDLAPHFIEICWRIRCFVLSNKIYCAYTTTKERRCLPQIENGDVGDPWIPIERDKGALTVGPNGYHYERLSHLLTQDEFEPAAAQVIKPGDGDPVLFIASAMARGQGKTEGLHERTLILNREVCRRLFHPDQRNALGKRSAERIERVQKMRKQVIYPALKTIALGEKIVKDTFDARINDIFFHELFKTIEMSDQEAKLAWDQRIVELARMELKRAIDRCTLASALKYRAIAAAEALFNSGLHKNFSDVMDAEKNHSQIDIGGAND